MARRADPARGRPVSDGAASISATHAPGGVWLRDLAPTRPRRNLTREEIVTQAIALLDDHGVQGLTMRAVAERLGVTSAALYWHVQTKEDVLDLAFDQVFASVELPPRDGPWRLQVRTLLSRWRAAMLAHPWSTALVNRPMLGPHVLERTEYLHAALARAGLTGTELVAAARVLANFVIGNAVVESSRPLLGADPDREGLPPQAHVADQGRYPTLVQVGHGPDRGGGTPVALSCPVRGQVPQQRAAGVPREVQLPPRFVEWPDPASGDRIGDQTVSARCGVWSSLSGGVRTRPRASQRRGRA